MQAQQAVKVFSGIQPSNRLHIGNLIGAIRHWIDLQNAAHFPCCFGVMDLHAMTSSSTAECSATETSSAFDVCLQLVACGIDPVRSRLFRQSQIPESLALFWWLATKCPLSRLTSMSHLKSKLETGASASVGLLAYPVLMAADILLHRFVSSKLIFGRATLVPVGEDQLQHLEFTRKLVKTANIHLRVPLFSVPTAISSDALYPKIMALNSPLKKMSKSHDQSKGTLFLLDSATCVKEKIMASFTDSLNSFSFDTKMQPGLANLIRIYAVFTGLSPDQVCAKFKGITNYRIFKEELIIAINNALDPIRNSYQMLKTIPAERENIKRIIEENEAKLQEECKNYWKNIQNEIKE